MHLAAASATFLKQFLFLPFEHLVGILSYRSLPILRFFWYQEILNSLKQTWLWCDGSADWYFAISRNDSVTSGLCAWYRGADVYDLRSMWWSGLILKRGHGSHADGDGKEEPKTVITDVFEGISAWNVASKPSLLVTCVCLQASKRCPTSQEGTLFSAKEDTRHVSRCWGRGCMMELASFYGFPFR